MLPSPATSSDSDLGAQRHRDASEPTLSARRRTTEFAEPRFRADSPSSASIEEQRSRYALPRRTSATWKYATSLAPSVTTTTLPVRTSCGPAFSTASHHPMAGERHSPAARNCEARTRRGRAPRCAGGHSLSPGTRRPSADQLIYRPARWSARRAPHEMWSRSRTGVCQRRRSWLPQ